VEEEGRKTKWNNSLPQALSRVPFSGCMHAGLMQTAHVFE